MRPLIVGLAMLTGCTTTQLTQAETDACSVQAAANAITERAPAFGDSSDQVALASSLISAIAGAACTWITVAK